MSRLPELEQELVATAARLSNTPRRFERRARALIPALAVACLVAAALVAGGLFDADEADEAGVHRGGAPAAKSGGFPPDATLEDMLGIFRRPQTATDDMGFTKEEMDEVPDRQPGEDFTKSRQVEWPGVRIFLWPMRNGVCYGVPGGSGCPPLDQLRRKGVSIGYGYSPGRSSVYGVVVDGIREVVLTAKGGGPELRVPVRENFFYADLDDPRVDQVRWRYAGQDQSFSFERSFPDDTTPPEPNAAFEPVLGSFGEPVSFSVGGVSYSGVGYQATSKTICIRLDDDHTDRPSLGCQGIRGLRQRLDEQQAELFGAGGNVRGQTVYKGFARADVVDAETVERTRDTTVVLSEPWTPAPWDGKPIRFLLVVDRTPEETDPGAITWPKLRVRLADGRSYLIES